jgi:DNA-directed RNA polymerase II subunit RPB1
VSPVSPKLSPVSPKLSPVSPKLSPLNPKRVRLNPKLSLVKLTAPEAAAAGGEWSPVNSAA